jgi:MoxR-like ATPase
VRAGRPAPGGELTELIGWGPGPRASQALMLAVRVRALLQERLAPSVDDVVALAPPVLRHRMALTFTARAEGMTLDRIIERLCGTIAG